MRATPAQIDDAVDQLTLPREQWTSQVQYRKVPAEVGMIVRVKNSNGRMRILKLSADGKMATCGWMTDFGPKEQVFPMEELEVSW